MTTKYFDITAERKLAIFDRLDRIFKDVRGFLEMRLRLKKRVKLIVFKNKKELWAEYKSIFRKENEYNILLYLQI